MASQPSTTGIDVRPATPPPHRTIPAIRELGIPTPQGTATDSPSRSPRLGQAAFDATVWRGGQEAPPYTARPRLLFPSVTATTDLTEEEDGDKPSSQAGHAWVLEPREPDGSRAPTKLPKQPGPPAGKSAVPAIRPSFRTLFSLTSRSTLWTVVVPGTAFAVGSGLVPPYMTMILGDALQAFTDYGLVIGSDGVSADVLKGARSTLVHDVRLHAVKFAVLAAVVLVTSTANIALWVIHGERVARELRTYVYRGVTAKGLDWYETGMGGDPDGGQDSATSSVDAAGLTGRFSKYAEAQSAPRSVGRH